MQVILEVGLAPARRLTLQKQIGRRHKLPRRSRVLQDDENPAAARLSQIQSQVEEKLGEPRIADRPRPLPVSLGHFRQSPPSLEVVELLHALPPYFDLSVRR